MERTWTILCNGSLHKACINKLMITQSFPVKCTQTCSQFSLLTKSLTISFNDIGLESVVLYGHEIAVSYSDLNTAVT